MTLHQIKPGSIVSINGIRHVVYFTGGAMAHTRELGGDHRCYANETECVLVKPAGSVDERGLRQGASH